MNIAQIIAVIQLLLKNKEEILELIKLIRTLFANENLIGDGPDAIVYDDSAAYPAVAKAVSAAGLDWASFIKVLVDNLDSIKELVTSIVEIIDLFKPKK
jgi:hypothetical protein